MMIEQMKPSGIECIGNIPKSWGAKRLRFILEAGSSGMKVGPFGSALSGSDYTDEGIWVYNQRTVLDNDFDEGTAFVSEQKYQELKDFSVYSGDILITTRGTIGKVAIVPTGAQKGILHPCIIKFRIDRSVMLPELLKLIFNESDIVKDQFTIMSNATTIEVIYSYSLKDIVLPIIPMSEQKNIFSFLHSQCSKLDSIISDLEKQIDTLQKYKKSLITETVTKGLDKSVPMKDSGIEWIGQIPEHWSVKRLKYVMNNFDSQRKPIEAQNRSQEGDVLYDYYGASGVIDKIDEYIFDETALLIGEDGANLVLRNLPLIYIAHGKYWVNNHAHILRPKKDSDLYYMAHQMEIIDYSLFITGSAQPKLSQENLNNVILVVPPLSEQKTMAEYLNEKVSNIDSIIQDKKKQLTIVQGHKKSLIYEYVTGKKRVMEVK